MYCPKCNSSIPDRAVFCVRCGSEVSAFGEQQGNPQPGYGGMPQYPPADAGYQQGASQPGYGGAPQYETNNPPYAGSGYQFHADNPQYPQYPQDSQQFPVIEPQMAYDAAQHMPSADPQYGYVTSAQYQQADPQYQQADPQYPPFDPQYPQADPQFSAYPNAQHPESSPQFHSQYQASPAKGKFSPLLIIIPVISLLIGVLIAVIQYGGLFDSRGAGNNPRGDANAGQHQTGPTDSNGGGATDSNQGANHGSGIPDNGSGIPDNDLQTDSVNISAGDDIEGVDAIPRLIQFNSSFFFALMHDAAVSDHRYTGYRGAEMASWAEREIGMADYLNLMPGAVMDYFDETATRGDYAALVYQFLLVVTGMSDSQLQSVAMMPAFNDSIDPAVGVCAGLGILTGNRDGYFRPNEPVSRQTAATILSRLADIAGVHGTAPAGNFSDISGLWGEEAVLHVSSIFDPFTGNTVMGATGGGNRFSPDTNVNRLQAVITILRLAGATAETYANQIPSNTIHTQDNLQAIQGSNSTQAAEGTFDTYMNLNWSFPNGSSPSSNAVLGNSPGNNYPFWFTLKLSNTDEIVLTSGLIPVGMEMAEIRMDVPLPAGEYMAELSINIVDYNGLPKGSVNINIALSVLS